MDDIEVSVVMPCLNEEKTIGICIEKIKEVFKRENIKGEIIVVDNGSTDNSKKIAKDSGAIVLLEKRKGYGSAYLCGLSHAKGKYIIMADSDNTYDFSDIPKFLEKLKEGYDFVIGSRFKGKIAKGAMHWSHRYIGNPILSFMCRLFFHTNLSDIHCGMRAFTYEAYQKMRLITLGMEFATEMVVSSIMNNLKITEVSINYYPRVGESKLRAFKDAYRHIRFMLMYCPMWLYFFPGIFGFLFGMLILVRLLFGAVLFLGHKWDIHLMILGSTLTILSYQIIHLGIYAHTYGVKGGFLKKDNFIEFLQKHFNLEKGLIVGFIFFLIGILINLFIFFEWITKQFGALYRIRESVFALTFIIIGLQTIFSSFFISLLFVERK